MEFNSLKNEKLYNPNFIKKNINKLSFLFLFIFSIAILFVEKAESKPIIDGNGSYSITAVETTKNKAIIGNFDGRIRIVNTKNSEISLLELVHRKEIISLSADIRGKYLLSTGSDDLNIVWNLETLKPVKRILKPGMGIRSSKISQNGDYIYLLYPYSLYIYNTKTWETEGIVEGFKESLYSLDINYNNKYAAIGSKDGNVFIVDLEKHKIDKKIKAGNKLIISVDFAAENNSLLVGGYDNVARLINPSKGEVLKEFSFFQDAVKSVSLNRNGTKAAFASSDGNILFYDFKNNRSFGKPIQTKDEIMFMAMDDSFKYAVIGVGTAYNNERYALLIYPERSKLYRKIYSFQDSDILITESGYISAIGSFGNKISSYRHGEKENYQTIINKYMNPKNLIVNY